LLFLAASLSLWRRSFRKKRGEGRVVSAALSALTLLLGGQLLVYSGFYFSNEHRPPPANEHKTLFQGIDYIRDVRSQPGPFVIDVVSIDLNAPGIHFLVTPGQPTNGYQLPSRTTSQFLYQFHVQLAVNGDCCEPWYSRFPWDYYPHVGDGVNVSG